MHTNKPNQKKLHGENCCSMFFNEQRDITKVKYLNLPFFSLLPHLLQVHLVALLTGNGQTHHQGHKLLEVHLSVSVGV